jgi:hypothetical protein
MKGIDFRNGIYLFISLIAFFGLMLLMGQEKNIGLHSLTLGLQFAIAYYAIRRFYEDNPDRKFNYLTGAVAGIRANIIGMFLYALVIFLYLTIDTSLMEYISNTVAFGSAMNPIAISIVMFFQGLGASVVLSYIAMRIVDNSYIMRYETRL